MDVKKQAQMELGMLIQLKAFDAGNKEFTAAVKKASALADEQQRVVYLRIQATNLPANKSKNR
jgi:hypothetical protein